MKLPKEEGNDNASTDSVWIGRMDDIAGMQYEPEDGQLTINDEQVSRRHCTIGFEITTTSAREGYVKVNVTDTSSKHGTFLIRQCNGTLLLNVFNTGGGFQYQTCLFVSRSGT